MSAPCKATLILFVAGFLLAGCKREQRVLRAPPALAGAAEMIDVSDLHAGGPAALFQARNGYEENAYAVNEGQQLFNSFNCSGCHAHGGGDKGPALMDDKWLYGSRPEQVFASIIQGRPRGMPTYRGRLNEHQTWQLGAYVRSLSGLTSATAAPGRDEHIQSALPPSSVKKADPKNVAGPE